MKKTYLFLLIFNVSINVVLAQSHTQFWLKASVQHKLNSKLSSSLELHHRTQSLVNTESPFRYPLTNAVRIWLIYKLSNKETINFSPYAFFSNHPRMINDEDIAKSNTNEHRIHIQYENREKSTHQIALWHRYGAEYRIFEGQENLLRFRFKEALQFSISKQLSFQIYDELFLNTTNSSKNHIFDQNRMGGIVHLKLGKTISLELGTIYTQALSRNGSYPIDFWMFQTNIISTL